MQVLLVSLPSLGRMCVLTLNFGYAMTASPPPQRAIGPTLRKPARGCTSDHQTLFAGLVAMVLVGAWGCDTSGDANRDSSAQEPNAGDASSGGTQPTEPDAGGGLDGATTDSGTSLERCAEQPSGAGLIWEQSFSSSNYEQNLTLEPCGNGSNPGCGCGDGVSLQSTREEARAGTGSGLSLLRTCHERAEFREKERNRAAVGDNRYYGFSLKPANNFDADRWTIVHQLAQWYPSIPSWADTDGGWHKITIERGRWKYTIKFSDGGPQDIRTQSFDLGEVQVGKWTDFVVHGRWRADGDGLFEVWIRQPGGAYEGKGRRVGSVIIDVPRAPYLKVGSYRGDPNWCCGEEQRLFVDEIRVGTTFSAVSTKCPAE